jgi:hypothetical protein
MFGRFKRITQEINMTNSQTIAHGRCMITESEGFVYAEFTCKGVLGACQGKFNITGGEGAFKGIQGSSDMVIRSALGAMAVDLKSGSVIQAAEGLAVWPNLKYTLPLINPPGLRFSGIYRLLSENLVKLSDQGPGGLINIFLFPSGRFSLPKCLYFSLFNCQKEVPVLINTRLGSILMEN